MNFGCENNIKRSSRYHPSEFCTKLNYVYTTRQCDEYFEYLEELRRIIFGENYRKMATVSEKSISYHTNSGKTLVYELEDTSNYGISLSSVPSEIVTTETFLAEEHVLPCVETVTVLPPTVSSSSLSSSTDNKLCHHLPMEIEERMKNCLNASAEIISSLSKEHIPSFYGYTTPYTNPYSLPPVEYKDDPESSSEDESDYTDQRGLEENIDEDFAILEDFATVLEESESVFEEVDDYTEDFDDFIISNDEVIELVHEVEYSLEWPVITDVISGVEELLPSPAAFSTSSWETVIERQLENLKHVEESDIEEHFEDEDESASSPKTVSSLIQFFENVAQKSRESTLSPKPPCSSQSSICPNTTEDTKDRALTSPVSTLPTFVSETLLHQHESNSSFAVPVENEASTHFSLFSHPTTEEPTEQLQKNENFQFEGDDKVTCDGSVQSTEDVYALNLHSASSNSESAPDCSTGTSENNPEVIKSSSQELSEESTESTDSYLHVNNSDVEDLSNLSESIATTMITLVEHHTLTESSEDDVSSQTPWVLQELPSIHQTEEEDDFPMPNECFEKPASTSSDSELMDLISAYVQMVLHTPRQLISTSQEEAPKEISTQEHAIHMNDKETSKDVNEQRELCLPSVENETGCHGLSETVEELIEPSLSQEQQDEDCSETSNIVSSVIEHLVDETTTSNDQEDSLDSLPQISQEFKASPGGQDQTVHVPEITLPMTVEENRSESIVSYCLISESSNVIADCLEELIQIAAENNTEHHSTTTAKAPMPEQDFPDALADRDKGRDDLVEDNTENQNPDAEENFETENSNSPIQRNALSSLTNISAEDEQSVQERSLELTDDLPSIPLRILGRRNSSHDASSVQEENGSHPNIIEEHDEETDVVVGDLDVLEKEIVDSSEESHETIKLEVEEEHELTMDGSETSLPGLIQPIDAPTDNGSKSKVIETGNLLEAPQTDVLEDDQKVFCTTLTIPTISVDGVENKSDSDNQRVEMIRQAILRSMSIIEKRGIDGEQRNTETACFKSPESNVPGKEAIAEQPDEVWDEKKEIDGEHRNTKTTPVNSSESKVSGKEAIAEQLDEVMDESNGVNGGLCDTETPQLNSSKSNVSGNDSIAEQHDQVLNETNGVNGGLCDTKTTHLDSPASKDFGNDVSAEQHYEVLDEKKKIDGELRDTETTGLKSLESKVSGNDVIAELHDEVPDESNGVNEGLSDTETPQLNSSESKVSGNDAIAEQYDEELEDKKAIDGEHRNTDTATLNSTEVLVSGNGAIAELIDELPDEQKGIDGEQRNTETASPESKVSGIDDIAEQHEDPDKTSDLLDSQDEKDSNSCTCTVEPTELHLLGTTEESEETNKTVTHGSLQISNALIDADVEDKDDAIELKEFAPDTSDVAVSTITDSSLSKLDQSSIQCVETSGNTDNDISKASEVASDNKDSGESDKLENGSDSESGDAPEGADSQLNTIFEEQPNATDADVINEFTVKEDDLEGEQQKTEWQCFNENPVVNLGELNKSGTDNDAGDNNTGENNEILNTAAAPVLTDVIDNKEVEVEGNANPADEFCDSETSHLESIDSSSEVSDDHYSQDEQELIDIHREAAEIVDLLLVRVMAEMRERNQVQTETNVRAVTNKQEHGVVLKSENLSKSDASVDDGTHTAQETVSEDNNVKEEGNTELTPTPGSEEVKTIIAESGTEVEVKMSTMAEKISDSETISVNNSDNINDKSKGSEVQTLDAQALMEINRTAEDLVNSVLTTIMVEEQLKKRQIEMDVAGVTNKQGEDIKELGNGKGCKSAVHIDTTFGNAQETVLENNNSDVKDQAEPVSTQGNDKKEAERSSATIALDHTTVNTSGTDSNAHEELPLLVIPSIVNENDESLVTDEKNDKLNSPPAIGSLLSAAAPHQETQVSPSLESDIELTTFVIHRTPSESGSMHSNELEQQPQQEHFIFAKEAVSPESEKIADSISRNISKDTNGIEDDKVADNSATTYHEATGNELQDKLKNIAIDKSQVEELSVSENEEAIGHADTRKTVSSADESINQNQTVTDLPETIVLDSLQTTTDLENYNTSNPDDVIEIRLDVKLPDTNDNFVVAVLCPPDSREVLTAPIEDSSNALVSEADAKQIEHAVKEIMESVDSLMNALEVGLPHVTGNNKSAVTSVDGAKVDLTGSLEPTNKPEQNTTPKSSASLPDTTEINNKSNSFTAVSKCSVDSSSLKEHEDVKCNVTRLHQSQSGKQSKSEGLNNQDFDRSTENVPTNDSLEIKPQDTSGESLNTSEQPKPSSVVEEVSYFLTTVAVAALSLGSSLENAPGSVSNPDFNTDIIEDASKYISSHPKPDSPE